MSGRADSDPPSQYVQLVRFPMAVALDAPAWETERMAAAPTHGTSDGRVHSRQGSHRARLRPSRLVGRDCEIVEVSERIALTPLTTLTGPAGVGKTALALAVADAVAPQFPDGVFVVWLASLRSEEHIAGEVASQVGMPKSGGQSYEDSLAEWLADRDVLLVLDNCEHMVSTVADLVEGLTARLPRPSGAGVDDELEVPGLVSQLSDPLCRSRRVARRHMIEDPITPAQQNSELPREDLNLRPSDYET